MQRDPTFLEETNARLIVYTGGDDPAVVTAMTGIQPSATMRKGDPSLRGTGIPSSLWELSSDDELSGVDVDVHVRWLLDQLERGVPALVDLLHVGEGWRAVLSLYAYMEDIDRVWFSLGPQEITRVAALECDLRVGIIICADEGHESAVDDDVTEAVFRQGDTEISSEGEVDSDHLSDHVAWLLPHARAAREQRPGDPAKIVLYWARDVSNGGIGLPAPLVAELATLDVKLLYVLMTAD